MNRCIGKAAGNGKFINAQWQFLRAHEGDDRRTAQNNGNRHFLDAKLLMFLIMLETTGTTNTCCHAHNKPVGRF